MWVKEIIMGKKRVSGVVDILVRRSQIVEAAHKMRGRIQTLRRHHPFPVHGMEEAVGVNAARFYVTFIAALLAGSGFVLNIGPQR